MGKIKSNTNPKRNVIVQIGAMHSRYPHFTARKLPNGGILFIGKIQPKEYMREYVVSIEYRGKRAPHVKVLYPHLVAKPPHYYHDQKRLCLYKPSDFSWQDTTLIANHIVSWTSAWLYFYEIWLQKGKWLGPEAEHDNKTPKI